MGCASSLESRGATLSIQEKYHFGHAKLGQGAYASVRLCVKKDKDEIRAVKIVECGNRGARADARQEAEIWKRVTGHRHIVNLLETYADKHRGYFVMERCAHSLFDMLQDKTHRPQEAQLLVTFQEMLLAVQHCHSVKVVHRDVKPANFLVSFDGVVKLCDFGLAELETEQGIAGRAGTAPFMSPEMVHGQRYNHKTDIWSLGASVYLMLYGKYPYQIRLNHCIGKAPPSERELMHRAIAQDSPSPSYMEEKGLRTPSPEAREFVQALLQRDAPMRPSSNECLHLRAMVIASQIQRMRGSTENKGTMFIECVDNKEQKEQKDTTFEVTDVIEVIDQLRERQAKAQGVIEVAEMIEVIRRSEDSPKIKLDSLENCSKDATDHKPPKALETFPQSLSPLRSVGRTYSKASLETASTTASGSGSSPPSSPIRLANSSYNWSQASDASAIESPRNFRRFREASEAESKHGWPMAAISYEPEANVKGCRSLISL